MSGEGLKSVTKDDALEPLLAEVSACRNIVDDYTKRLDDACAEYYQSGKIDFYNLSRAENEDISQRCESVVKRLAPVLADVSARWQAIRYPSDQYKEMVERMRDVWTRKRNLLREAEHRLATALERGKAAIPSRERQTMTAAHANHVLIIHGHDERNVYVLKDLLHSKLGLAEPVIMAQQMVPGASLPEKFERLAGNVQFAVALLTPDDQGCAVAASEWKPRPRQNTLIEIGWFWGRLGRDRVLLLVKEELELPSDLQGLEYYRFQTNVEDVSEKIRDFFAVHQQRNSA